MSARHRQAKKRLYMTRAAAAGLERLLEAYDLVLLDVSAWIDDQDVIHADLDMLRDSVAKRLADLRAAIVEQETVIAGMPARLDGQP